MIRHGRISLPSRVWRTAIIAALAFSIGSATVAFGLVVNGVVEACYNNASGILRLATATRPCISASETSISWNQIGPQGIQGIQGPKGDKGDTGLQGVEGIQGIQGLKGDQGIQGIQGLKGDQGTQGIQGEKGDQGAAGPQGDPGTPGAKGDTGETGPAGPAGSPGSAGVTSITAGFGLNGNPTDIITTEGFLEVDPFVIQRRVNGNCGVGSSIRAINVDGTVECQGAADVEVTPLPAGPQCPTGGIQITTGTSTNYVCNGQQGPAGPGALPQVTSFSAQPFLVSPGIYSITLEAAWTLPGVGTIVDGAQTVASSNRGTAHAIVQLVADGPKTRTYFLIVRPDDPDHPLNIEPTDGVATTVSVCQAGCQ